MTEKRIFRTAIELDEYLANLPPEDFKPPTPLKDQVTAARKEGVAETEKRLGHKAHWVPHKGTPDWLRLGQLDVLLKWHDGQVLTCIHQPVPSRPEPVYAAAWLPGRVVCAQCTHMLALTGVADTICDGCGHECKGLPDDGIMPVTSFIGSLGYQVGVCVDCHKDLLQAEREANEKEQHNE